MSDRALAWLAAQAAEVPPSLQTRMEQAVRAVTQDSVHADAAQAMTAGADADVTATLVAASVDCLRAALRDCDDRAAALHLLAADALVTYACARAADAGAAALDAVSRDLATGRLEGIVAGQVT